MTDAQGILVKEIFHRSGLANTVHNIEIWGQPRTVDGNYDVINFELLATGTASSPTTTFDLFRVDVTDFFLATGTTGLAIVSRAGGHAWWTDNAGQVTSNSELSITPRGYDTNFDTQTNNAITSAIGGFSGGLIYDVGIAPGSVIKFGNGCPGSLGVPDIQPGINPPTAGQIFAAKVTGIQAGVQVHAGISNQFNNTFGVPLPLFLGPILGAQNTCRFRVSSEVIIPAVPDFFGDAVVTIPIPNTPLFQGLTGYFQAVVFDSTVPGSVIVSNAFLAVII